MTCYTVLPVRCTYEDKSPLKVDKTVEEGDLHSIDLSDHYGVGRLSVRGVGEYLLYEFEVVGIVDPGTADESNLRHICRIVEVLF